MTDFSRSTWIVQESKQIEVKTYNLFNRMEMKISIATIKYVNKNVISQSRENFFLLFLNCLPAT